MSRFMTNQIFVSAKPKVQISYAVTAQLISTFVFTSGYAKTKVQITLGDDQHLIDSVSEDR